MLDLGFRGADEILALGQGQPDGLYSPDKVLVRLTSVAIASSQRALIVPMVNNNKYSGTYVWGWKVRISFMRADSVFYALFFGTC